MDEQLNQGIPDSIENTEPISDVREPVQAEEPILAEAPVSEEEPIPQVSQPEPAPTSQWQGGYSYQNPNPYQNYQPYSVAPQPKKKENLGLIVVAATAVGIMFLCCLVITIATVFNLTGVHHSSDADETVTENETKNETADKQTGLSERDDKVVYNMPEITKEEKSGEILSIVEINKKLKNSVVAVLISMSNDEETEFSGSGFIISEDGYIITNAHVIEDASLVEVVLIDGITSYTATIVGQDERSDLAILKVDATGLSPAELGNSDQLEEGEEVVCIGNPYGMELSGSITNGIVSALNRKIEMNGGYMTLIQTNAEINPGNSGGPLINSYGQVVGITSSKLVATGYEGIGFAIPINDAITISEELINYGFVKSRAYIGFSGTDLTEAYAKYHNMPQGVYVVHVEEDRDAAKKGLKEDDVVIGFNGEEIKSMAELNDLKDAFHPGDNVKITVWRDGETFDLEITLFEASE